MTTETPAQRRTRLIEQYVKSAIIATPDYSAEQMVAGATFIADAVIAATPQEPPTRYPSEAETRLIELVQVAIDSLACQFQPEDIIKMVAPKLAAIKRDLGLP